MGVDGGGLGIQPQGKSEWTESHAARFVDGEQSGLRAKVGTAAGEAGWLAGDTQTTSGASQVRVRGRATGGFPAGVGHDLTGPLGRAFSSQHVAGATHRAGDLQVPLS